MGVNLRCRDTEAEFTVDGGRSPLGEWHACFECDMNTGFQ